MWSKTAALNVAFSRTARSSQLRCKVFHPFPAPILSLHHPLCSVYAPQYWPNFFMHFLQHQASCLHHWLFVDTNAIHHLGLPAKCLCRVLFVYAYTLFKIYLITHLVAKHACTLWKGIVQAAGVCSCARRNVWSSSACTEAFSATNFTAL